MNNKIRKSAKFYLSAFLFLVFSARSDEGTAKQNPFVIKIKPSLLSDLFFGLFDCFANSLPLGFQRGAMKDVAKQNPYYIIKPSLLSDLFFGLFDCFANSLSLGFQRGAMKELRSKIPFLSHHSENFNSHHLPIEAEPKTPITHKTTTLAPMEANRRAVRTAGPLLK